MMSYQYRKSDCGDQTVVRSSDLHNGISYTGKIASLYWTIPCSTVSVRPRGLSPQVDTVQFNSNQLIVTLWHLHQCQHDSPFCVRRQMLRYHKRLGGYLDFTRTVIICQLISESIWSDDIYPSHYIMTPRHLMSDLLCLITPSNVTKRQGQFGTP